MSEPRKLDAYLKLRMDGATHVEARKKAGSVDGSISGQFLTALKEVQASSWYQDGDIDWPAEQVKAWEERLAEVQLISRAVAWLQSNGY